MNVRAAAAEVIARVLRGQSLSALLPLYSHRVTEKNRSLLKQLCFGTLRWYPKIAILLKVLIKKPLRDKDLAIQALIACAIYQMLSMRIAAHAIVNESVAAATELKRPWAKGLVNGVLRNLQRQQLTLLEQQADNRVFQTAHPQWLLDKISDSWDANRTGQIIAANNQRAPMVLRVNVLRQSREAYLQRLAAAGIAGQPTPYSAQGIVLQTAVDVDELPDFHQGYSSVQDEAAQLAAELLMLDPGQSVLDACCAPGGKTCHLLETQPKLGSLLAIDLDSQRLVSVQENLQRLGLQAKLVAADACDVQNWWDKKAFDRILLDAPCSATGVIRRHPDIKVLRKPTDIDKLATIQRQLLDKLWQTLNKGGILLYATCSILAEENDQIIAQFLAQNTSATPLCIDAAWGIKTDYGRQLLPTINGNDGFYYARLQKEG